MLNLSEKYKPMPFETEIFEAPVWQLLDVIAAPEVVSLAKVEKVALVSFREEIAKYDAAKTLCLKEAGFYEIETLTTLQQKIATSWPAISSTRIALKEDADACAKIAAICFKDDRYHADKNIDNKIADKIKSSWVYNSVSGRADAVFVCEDEDHQILGFNACMFRENIAIIDLIGVHPDHQGKGIGRALLSAMEQHYIQKADFVRLGTQLSNQKSQVFYKSLGFVEISRYVTWHWSR